MKVIGQFDAPAAVSPGAHYMGGWLGPSNGLDGEKKSIFLLTEIHIHVYSMKDAHSNLFTQQQR
jgi:hypothetical protein